VAGVKENGAATVKDEHRVKEQMYGWMYFKMILL